MEIHGPEPRHSSRREWINVIIHSAAGAALVTGAVNAQEHRHESPGHLDTQTDPSWTPSFLSPEQNQTLVMLGEAIIPGSKEAGCNRIIDLVLTIDSEKNKSNALNALSAFDSAARKSYGKPVSSLQPSSLHELLVNASSSNSPLWPAFSLLKEWLADTYWSSKPGLQEMGWTGRVAWAKFDGCPHTDHHHA